jgi:1-acyl-sn-glycerol-3-phosphate acyltransferase
MTRVSLEGEVGSAEYRMAHAGFGAMARALYRLEVSGIEHVPAEGALVVAGNHLSNSDPVFFGVSFPRQIHFMAKSEIWHSRVLGLLVSRVGAFPVHRGEADRAAVRTAFEHLAAGRVLGIFPEGHRQKSGHLGQVQAGVGMFSLRPGVTTIPMAITGTDRIVRGRLPRFPKVRVAIGPPVEIEDLPPTKSGRNREVSHRIMQAIAALLGEEWSPSEVVS